MADNEDIVVPPPAPVEGETTEIVSTTEPETIISSTTTTTENDSSIKFDEFVGSSSSSDSKSDSTDSKKDDSTVTSASTTTTDAKDTSKDGDKKDSKTSSSILNTPSKLLRKLRKDEVKEGIASDAVQSAASLTKAAQKGGYLTKRSDQGLIKNWKKRWVMLCSNLLYYFEAETSVKPQGIVQLDGSFIQKASQKQFKNQECIVIKTKAGRCFYFYGSSYENKAWFDLIRVVQGVTVVGASTSLEESKEIEAAVNAVEESEIQQALTASRADDGDSLTIVTLPPAGKRKLDASTDLGVTDAVNAMMTSLPPDIQVVWLRVLTAACRSREVEDELSSNKALLTASQEALAAQKSAALEIANSIANDANLRDRLAALAEGVSGDATMAGTSDAYEQGRQDGRNEKETELRSLRDEFDLRLRKAVEEAESNMQKRMEAENNEAIEAIRNAERAARREIEQKAADAATAEAATRNEESTRLAIAKAVAEKEEAIAELQRRLAGAEAVVSEQNKKSGSSEDINTLRNNLASTEAQLKQVGTQLELLRVKADGDLQALNGRDSRIKQLETDLASAIARADKASTDAANEFVKVTKLENEMKRLNTRLQKADQAEKYAAFQADEIMQAKASYLNSRDEADRYRKALETLQKEFDATRNELETVRESVQAAVDKAIQANAEHQANALRDAVAQAVSQEQKKTSHTMEQLEEVRAELNKTKVLLAESKSQISTLESAVERAQKHAQELQSAISSAAKNVQTTGIDEATHASVVAARDSALADAADARNTLATESNRVKELNNELTNVKDELAKVHELYNNTKQELEVVQNALASAKADVSSAAEAANANVVRLQKSLAGVVNMARESVGVKGVDPQQPGSPVDLFGFRDSLRTAVENACKEAADKEKSNSTFARGALEKKIAAAEERIQNLTEEKHGLEAELQEHDEAEERMKRDITAWMARARELEEINKGLEEKSGRLDGRVHQLEMSLAEAKAKLYNVSKPLEPSQV